MQSHSEMGLMETIGADKSSHSELEVMCRDMVLTCGTIWGFLEMYHLSFQPTGTEAYSFLFPFF